MSLDLINHKLTTSTTDENGTTWWTNPAIDVKINSKGKIVSLKTGKEKPSTKIGHCFRVMNGKISKSTQASFESLFCRVVLGKKLQGSLFSKLDETQDYSEENYEIVCNTGAKVSRGDLLKVLSGQEVLGLKCNDLSKQFYTVYEAKNEHITEDGAVFPTLELAQWHQEKVSKGKGNAQVVLDYNGGYVLAEQIYLQEVVYNKATPYTNFVDVLNNNQGIVSNVQEEHYKFDKLEGEGLGALFMFGLNDLTNLVCSTKTQAEKINTYVNQYSKAYKELDESVVGIKKLISLVK